MMKKFLGIVSSLLWCSALAAQCNSGETLCGEKVGQCNIQLSFGANVLGPFDNTADGPSGCCYDPDVHHCGAGGTFPGEDFVTPLKAPKKWFDRDLYLCGLYVVDTPICRESACTDLGYEGMCLLSKACVNHLQHCPGYEEPQCPTGQTECGEGCFDRDTQFCLANKIYSKATHFECGGRAYPKGATSSCCGSTVYNPLEKSCCSGRVYDDTDRGCCSGRTFSLETSVCCGGNVVAKFDTSTHHCIGGIVCRIEEDAYRGQCYEPGSAEMGDTCLRDNHCERGECSNSKICICLSDGHCPTQEYCNVRPFDPNRCLEDRTLALDRFCYKNRQCISNKCQGSRCVCDDDGDCPRNYFCNNRLSANRCLADGTLNLGDSCAKNQECRSDKCQGSRCVCDDDGDCPRNYFCNNRLSANRCLADGALNLGDSCAKNRECRSDKCQGGNCVCADDVDCSRNQYCNVRVGSPNRCLSKKSEGSSCSGKGQCYSNCCKVYRFRPQCRPSSKCT